MPHLDDPATREANARYIRSAMEEPMLEREHELQLARRWKEKGDEKALHELINAYRRLVVSIAAKFRSYSLPLSDLIQEGNIGLMEASCRFDPELENRFSTYAAWWVKAQIQSYVLRNWSIVRAGTTTSQKTLFFNLRRLRIQQKDQAAREYLDKEAAEKIAKELRVTPQEVMEMSVHMDGDWSLNSTIGENGEDEWQDLLADHRPTPEEAFIRRHDTAAYSKWLSDALISLDGRERTIIEKRHLHDPAATLGELGDDLGVSKERIRQLEHKALEKLKTAMLVHDQKLDLA